MTGNIVPLFMQIPTLAVQRVSVLGVACSAVLIVLAVGISVIYKLGLSRTIVWAALRMLVQLLLVGIALGLVLNNDGSLWFAWAWVAGMVIFAAWTTHKRAPEVPGAFGLACFAFTLTLLVSLGVLFGLQVFPVEGRTIVPISGMVIGNALSATVLVGRRIVTEVHEKRLEIEARLALGQTAKEASRPYLRAALRTALIPQIETTKATGIVMLPGTMVGLILAGVNPTDAVKVQIAVMYMILGSVATTTTIIALGLMRKLFTPDHRLVDIAEQQ